MEICERPIIFKSDMVRAILENRKTMTRRPIKPQPPNEAFEVFSWYAPNIPKEVKTDEGCYYRTKKGLHFHIKCPYDQIGDRLWIRETWAMIYKNSDCCIQENLEIDCPCNGCNIEYRADTGNPYPGEWDAGEAKGNDDAPKWRPSIHMPRWASRINLEITNIRVERLQEITNGDVLKEGFGKENVRQGETRFTWFTKLWNSIYGKDSWNQNPWIWCISFKRIL